jgi:hypothetical protein
MEQLNTSRSARSTGISPLTIVLLTEPTVKRATLLRQPDDSHYKEYLVLPPTADDHEILAALEHVKQLRVKPGTTAVSFPPTELSTDLPHTPTAVQRARARRILARLNASPAVEVAGVGHGKVYEAALPAAWVLRGDRN